MQFKEHTEQQRCPLCWDPLGHLGTVTRTCSGCGTEYHLECLIELAGCSTLGCPNPQRRGLRPTMTPPRVRPPAPTRRRLRWLWAGAVAGMCVIGAAVGFASTEAAQTTPPERVQLAEAGAVQAAVHHALSARYWAEVYQSGEFSDRRKAQKWAEAEVALNTARMLYAAHLHATGADPRPASDYHADLMVWRANAPRTPENWGSVREVMDRIAGR